MSASSIPNLATFRNRTGLRNRGGGRGRGRPDPQAPHESNVSIPTLLSGDAAVQDTDNDAISARMSAVNLGYLDDPWAKHLHKDHYPKRYPIINRGTCVRTRAIDRLLTLWLDAATASATMTGDDDDGPRAQIVSLGAGSDTRPFRLLNTYKKGLLIYHEIDFATNTKRKISALRSSSELRDAAGLQTDGFTIDPSGTNLSSPTYSIHALDLRELGELQQQQQQQLALSARVPTVFLSECCLCYATATDTSAIYAHLLSRLNERTPAATILYEPIRPHDAFGRTMFSNLAARGLQMPSLQTYPTLASQRRRLVDCGFGTGQGARDVEGIYYGGSAAAAAADDDDEGWVSDRERARIDGLEWLDEVEEWRLLAAHYAVCWAWRGGPSTESDETETGLSKDADELETETVIVAAAATSNEEDDDDDDARTISGTETRESRYGRDTSQLQSPHGSSNDIFTRAWGSIRGGWTESEKKRDE